MEIYVMIEKKKNRGRVEKILPRKIVAASISGSIFAVIFGFVFHSLGEESSQGYLVSAITVIPFYMMYSFPVILIYGVCTSIISDKFGEFISKENKRTEWVVSAILHILFGLILKWISLGASFLFFITDRLLRRRKPHYLWAQALKSLCIPIGIWLVCMCLIWVGF
jgi:magnesium-transporting ATPase (P-type)